MGSFTTAKFELLIINYYKSLSAVWAETATKVPSIASRLSQSQGVWYNKFLPMRELRKWRIVDAKRSCGAYSLAANCVLSNYRLIEGWMAIARMHDTYWRRRNETCVSMPYLSYAWLWTILFYVWAHSSSTPEPNSPRCLSLLKRPMPLDIIFPSNPRW